MLLDSLQLATAWGLLQVLLHQVLLHQVLLQQVLLQQVLLQLLLLLEHSWLGQPSHE